MPFDATPLSPGEVLTPEVAKPDVFSLEGLIAWLEKQPGENRYSFGSCTGSCLVGEYLIATTGKMWHAHGLSWGLIHCRYPELTRVAAETPHTFGAALTRARQALLDLKKSK